MDERKFVITPSFPAALRPSSNRTFAITAKDVYGTVIPCTSSSVTRVTMEPNWIVAQSCLGHQFEITVRSPDAEGTHNDVEFRFDQILFALKTFNFTLACLLPDQSSLPVLSFQSLAAFFIFLPFSLPSFAFKPSFLRSLCLVVRHAPRQRDGARDLHAETDSHEQLSRSNCVRQWQCDTLCDPSALGLDTNLFGH